MDMDYKPNSHKYKAEQKAKEEHKVQKVVKGPVKTQKKSELSRVAKVFISEDSSNIKSYVLEDVVIPTIKKTIISVIDMLLNGGNATYTRSSGNRPSYRQYYDDKKDDRRRDDNRNKSRFDFDDIVYNNRGDAEMVLDSMEDAIDRYSFVTVADMYDMAGYTAPYTADRYGWTSLRNAEVVRLLGGGYKLKLPRPMVID